VHAGHVMVYMPLGVCKPGLSVCTWFAPGLHGTYG
jgi:hypothetical protein